MDIVRLASGVVLFDYNICDCMQTDIRKFASSLRVVSELHTVSDVKYICLGLNMSILASCLYFAVILPLVC